MNGDSRRDYALGPGWEGGCCERYEDSVFTFSLGEVCPSLLPERAPGHKEKEIFRSTNQEAQEMSRVGCHGHDACGRTHCAYEVMSRSG